MRGVAVAAVLLAHTWPALLPGGHLGVDVFFVLSGFLIGRLLMRPDAPSWHAFLARRFWRLAPALAIVLAATALATWAFLTPYETLATMPFLLGAATWTTPLLAPAAGDYFAPDAQAQPLLHTWSLGVEAAFYLCAPVLLAAWRWRPRAALVAVGGLAIASFAWMAWLHLHAHPAAHLGLAARLWQPLVGLALSGLWPVHRDGAGHPLLGWAGAGLFAALCLLPVPASPAAHLAAVAAGGLLVVARPPGWLVARPLLWAGAASYGAYLWHQPLAAFARALADVPAPALALGVGGAALALGAASAAWVEAPLRRWAKGWDSLHALPAAAALAAAGCVAALSALGTQGWAARSEGLPFVPGRAEPATAWALACGERLEGPWCTTGWEDGPDAPGVALWGDSFSMALAAGWKADPTLGPLLHLGVNGCPVRLTGPWQEGGRPCLERHQEALAAIAGDARVTTVVLHGRWTPPPGGDIPRLVEETESAIAAVQALGRRPVLLVGVPAYPRSIEGAAWRAWRWGWGPSALPRTTLEDQRADPTRGEQAIKELGARMGVEVLDVGPLLCPQDLCIPTGPNGPTHFDEEHLRASAARGVAAFVQRALASP